jgi:hypothetical protein
MHPAGTKADYNFRIESQARALRAGFDQVGVGALFGLHAFPIAEIEGLRQHVASLEAEFGQAPSRLCLPSASEPGDVSVNIPYAMRRGRNGDFTPYEKVNELLYALVRLAMPLMNIVSSERDRPEMLAVLDQYATCTTLNVHPAVGGNAGLYQIEESATSAVHFEQAWTFARSPRTTLAQLRSRGYNPIFRESK